MMISHSKPTVLRPIVNSDHVIVTVKIPCDWSKVDVEKRVDALNRAENDAKHLYEFINGLEEQ